MGLLDSMLGELVRRETGFNATRLIRRIGSKRLLMMGGAALAGGVLAQKASGGNEAGGLGSAMFGSGTGNQDPKLASTGTRRQSLPPVPGTVSASVAPNLPPVPLPAQPSAAPGAVPPLPNEDSDAFAEGRVDQASQELLYAVVRTMVAAALSDGELDAAEKAAIDRHLADSGLSERQQAQVRRDLIVPAATAELAGMVPEGEDPEILLEFAVLVLRADGSLQDSERAWLHSLAGFLSVEDARREELVQEMVGDLFPAAD